MPTMRKLVRTSTSEDPEIMSVLVREDCDKQYPLIRRIFRNARIVRVNFTYDNGQTVEWQIAKEMDS